MKASLLPLAAAGMVLTAQAAAAADQYVTVDSSAQIGDFELIQLSLGASGELATVDDMYELSGYLFAVGSKGMPIVVEVPAEPGFDIEDDIVEIDTERGTVTLERFTYNLEGDVEVTKYLYHVRPPDEPPISLFVTDDPAWWIVPAVYAGCTLAICGAQFIYNAMSDCDAIDGSLRVSLAGASCDYRCVRNQEEEEEQ